MSTVELHRTSSSASRWEGLRRWRNHFQHKQKFRLEGKTLIRATTCFKSDWPMVLPSSGRRRDHDQLWSVSLAGATLGFLVDQSGRGFSGWEVCVRGLHRRRDERIVGVRKHVECVEQCFLH